jgi:hypothetical protein
MGRVAHTKYDWRTGQKQYVSPRYVAVIKIVSGLVICL